MCRAHSSAITVFARASPSPRIWALIARMLLPLRTEAFTGYPRILETLGWELHTGGFGDEHHGTRCWSTGGSPGGSGVGDFPPNPPPIRNAATIATAPPSTIQVRVRDNRRSSMRSI